MKPTDIELTMGDMDVRDKIVREIRPMSESEILRTAGETMRAERVRVVALIDRLMSKHETAMEALKKGDDYQKRQFAWMALSTARKFILDGHQEAGE